MCKVASENEMVSGDWRTGVTVQLHNDKAKFKNYINVNLLRVVGKIYRRVTVVVDRVNKRTVING